MSTRVNVDFDDDQLKTLNLVTDHYRKKMGSTISRTVVIRAVLEDYARRNRLEGVDEQDNSRSGS
jgi:hypothetical protein